MMLSIERSAASLRRWLFPTVDENIADPLRRAQIDSLKTQIPLLLAVAGLNTGILMASCAQAGLPLAHYGWMSLLIVYTLVRGGHLRRQFAGMVTREQQDRLIRTTSRAALAMLALLGTVAGASYASGFFAQSLLIPMSLGFGSISIAHCLYRLRAIAMGALVLGIVPSAGTLLLIGDFQAQMLGISMVSVALLMMRFVAAQYDQLIDNLHLQHHILTIANSDPLTGLANRRAVTACLDSMASPLNLGIALLDLNDFKLINDHHGHDVGDALLQHVARALQSAAPDGAMVGRLGGDEFVMLCAQVADERAMLGLANRLATALVPPARVDQLVFPISASIGYAVGTVADANSKTLMKRADDMLYAAKRLKDPATRPSSRFAA